MLRFVTTWFQGFLLDFVFHARARREVVLTTSLVISSPFVIFDGQKVNEIEKRCRKGFWPSAKPRQAAIMETRTIIREPME